MSLCAVQLVLLTMAFGGTILYSAHPVGACDSPVECVNTARHMPLDERLGLLVESHERWPDDPFLSLETATACIAAEQYALALRVLDGGTAPDQQYAAVYAVQSSIVHLRLGNADEALRILGPYARGAVAQHAFSPPVHVYVHALIDLDRVDDAQKILQQFSPASLETSLRHVYYVESARVALAESDGAKAASFLCSAAQIGNDAHIQVFRALVAAWNGDFSAASTLAEDIDPQALRSEYRLIPGLLNVAAQSQTSSDKLYQQQIKEHPYEQSGYLALAARLSGQGRTSDACETIKQGRTRCRSSTLLDPPWLSECTRQVDRTVKDNTQEGPS